MMLEKVSEDQWSRGRLFEALMGAVALILPWAIITAVLRSRPALGFYVGFTAGVICLWIFRPRRIQTWKLVALYGVVLLLRFVLGPSFIH